MRLCRPAVRKASGFTWRLYPNQPPPGTAPFVRQHPCVIPHRGAAEPLVGTRPIKRNLNKPGQRPPAFGSLDCGDQRSPLQQTDLLPTREVLEGEEPDAS